MTREETAEKFAAAMGWTLMGEWFFGGPRKLYFPQAGQQLRTHMTFVGRVAEQFGSQISLYSIGDGTWACAFFGGRGVSYGSDPSVAAMNAAIDVKAWDAVREAAKGAKP